MNDNDTIVAVATPPGAGGIGVVRISGGLALPLALEIFRHSGKKYTTENFPKRKAVYGEIVDPDKNNTLDHSILTWFPPGASYTGESVVEISCHGSRPILRRVVEIVSKRGARLSGPGEFTLRAVLAGRLDLTQAEAVNRLIRADTLVQAEAAVRQLEGEVSKRVNDLEDDLLNTIAAMEAEVDFAEEDESFSHREHVEKKLKSIVSALDSVIRDFSKANTLRDGAIVVIAGKSNAGKSTLFNALLETERAIVDSTPGTTRDYISETFEMDGLPISLYDTAGLRQTVESVEKEGMRRSENLILTADLVIHVTVAGETLTEDDQRIRAALDERNIPVIQIRNKVDKLPDSTANDSSIAVSALQGIGLDKLKEAMREHLQIDEISSSRGFVTEKRQQQLFLMVRDFVHNGLMNLQEGAYDELILEELNSAMTALSEITGRGGKEEILGRIFSSFCIGK